MGSLGTTPRNVPIAVVNYDGGPSSISFMSLLESQNMLNVVSMTNQQDAMSMLSNGQVTAVVVIPAGFASSAKGAPNVVVYLDASVASSSSAVTAAVSSAAARFGASMVSQSVQAKAAAASTFSVATNYAYGASSNYTTFLVAGTLIMVASFGSIFSGGFSIITDRQLGNLKAFMASPVNKLSILLSKMAYGVTQSMLSGVLALAVGLLLGASIYSGLSGIPVILWFMFLCGLAFSGISTALATRINKIETYALISQTIVMPLYFLSGAFMPTNTLPQALQVISTYNPMTYGVNAVREVMLKGYLTQSAFVFNSAVLLAFLAFTVGLSFVLFKRTNDNA
jgi:ABC-2 type transport system permease protein